MGFPKLVSLELKASYSLSAKGLENLLILDPQLEKIGIPKNKHMFDSIPVILSHCPHLTHLDVSENKWFRDNTLDLLTESGLQLRPVSLFSMTQSPSQARVV
jgi:hypothetical protein